MNIERSLVAFELETRAVKNNGREAGARRILE